MGFSGGTPIARDMVEVIQMLVTDEGTRRGLYVALIDTLEDADWDTKHEAMGIDPVYDQIIQRERDADDECNRTGIHPIYQR